MARALSGDRADPRKIQKRLEALRDRLSRNVFRLRGEKKWNQEEAAWRTAIGLRMYQRIEEGNENVNATLRTLARLSAGFGVDETELLKLGAPPRPKPARGRPKTESSGATKAKIQTKIERPSRSSRR